MSSTVEAARARLAELDGRGFANEGERAERAALRLLLKALRQPPPLATADDKLGLQGGRSVALLTLATMYPGTTPDIIVLLAGLPDEPALADRVCAYWHMHGQPCPSCEAGGTCQHPEAGN